MFTVAHDDESRSNRNLASLGISREDKNTLGISREDNKYVVHSKKNEGWTWLILLFLFFFCCIPCLSFCGILSRVAAATGATLTFSFLCHLHQSMSRMQHRDLNTHLLVRSLKKLQRRLLHVAGCSSNGLDRFTTLVGEHLADLLNFRFQVLHLVHW